MKFFNKVKTRLSDTSVGSIDGTNSVTILHEYHKHNVGGKQYLSVKVYTTSSTATYVTLVGALKYLEEGNGQIVFEEGKSYSLISTETQPTSHDITFLFSVTEGTSEKGSSENEVNIDNLTYDDLVTTYCNLLLDGHFKSNRTSPKVIKGTGVIPIPVFAKSYYPWINKLRNRLKKVEGKELHIDDVNAYLLPHGYQLEVVGSYYRYYGRHYSNCKLVKVNRSEKEKVEEND